MKKLLLGESISTIDIAQKFNITESDVLNAWKHWESVGIIKFDNTSMSVTFLPVNVPENTDISLPAPVISKSIASRPQYTIDELTGYRNQNRDVSRLFERAEHTLGKLLTYNDMNIIFSFHDWLRLPIDVIEYLFIYCEENDHRNLRYIEKCALDWADNEINNLDGALDYVKNFDKNYRTILHYMGQTSGYPTPSHRKYMDKWLDQWKMPLDLVMEACDRCVSQIDKPKFNYIDRILSEWHKKDITDITGVIAADAEFAKSKESSIISIDKKTVKQKPNRFVNFTQRDNDYSRYEQLERAYLEQKLK
jgi:DnaD/phage-associated family protein